MTKNIIIFQNSPDEEVSLFGFKIFNQKSAKHFMKAISILANSNEKFEYDNISIDYDVEKFELMKVSSTDIKTLSKLFNVENEEESVGIFPDAINDAYELGLMSDEEDEDEDYLNDYE